MINIAFIKIQDQAQIHEIALKEVHRITEEMGSLAKANGYQDLASFRNQVENDPKYQPASADAIVEDFPKYIAQVEPRLPQLFHTSLITLRKTLPLPSPSDRSRSSP